MATIRITQFLRPNRQRAIVFADIPDELKGKADLLEISAEALPMNKVMIYAHVKGQSEEDELTELADRDQGPNDPLQALIRLIRRF